MYLDSNHSLFIPFTIARSLAILASIFISVCRYLVGDTNFKIVFLSLGLTFFSITVMEYYVQKKKSIPFTMSMGMLSWVFLALLGFLKLTFLSYSIGLIGLLGTLHSIFIYYKNIEKNAKKSLFKYFIVYSLLFILVTCLALTNLKTIYGGRIVTLFFLEDFINGNIHIDSLFHTVLIETIQTYTIPSIGLDGVLYVKYHNLTNIFYSYWGALIGSASYQSYSYLHSIVVFPFFFLYFILFAVQCSTFFYKNLNIFFLVFLLIIINVGLLPTEVTLNLKTGFFNMEVSSPSLILGGILLFSFFSFIIQTLQTNKIYWLPYIILCLLGMYAKGTLLFVLAPVLSIYFMFTKNIKGFLISVIINIACLLFYYLLYYNPNYGTPIDILGYMKYNSEKGFYLYNFILAHLSVFVSIYFLLRYSEQPKSIVKKEKINTLIVVLFSASLISYLVISVFNFGHNSGAFLQNARWIGLGVLVALMSEKIDIYFKSNKFISLPSKSYILFMVLFYFGTNFLVTTARHSYTLLKEIQSSVQIYQANETNESNLVKQRKEFLTLLEGLSKIENKENYLIFIPHQDKYIEEIFPDTDMKKIKLLVPALTGIALLDGVEQRYFDENNGYYGFSDYINPNKIRKTYTYSFAKNVPSKDKGKKIIVFQPSQLNYYIKE